MKTRFYERGDTMAVVFAVLVVALMAALGVIFYQNFVAKQVDTSSQSQTADEIEGDQSATARVAFGSTIYELDYPEDWTATTEKVKESTRGGSLTRIATSDNLVAVTFRVSEKEEKVKCDSSSGLKVRHYKVYDAVVKDLTKSSLRLVEAMSDREGGGYNYVIGLTQEGGGTHSFVGATRCTVANAGIASYLRAGDEQIVQPSIVAQINFPKLPEAKTLGAKSMDDVMRFIETQEYKTAIKILQSARKK